MDFQFADGVTGSIIYDPKTVAGGATSTGPVLISVTNVSSSDYADLGFYIRAASSIGDVDNPANYPPATDFQDLITWGSDTTAGLQPSGGLIVSYTDSSGSPVSSYVTRSAGSLYSNKLSYGTLAAGSSFQLSLELEVPPAVVARRLFVDIVAE
jgi:hypothetical protein